MFLDQDYAAKELVILNDCCGQTFQSNFPNIRVINTATRFRTLGEKRNACIEAARGDFVAIWDDDDVYLPWRLSYSMQELRRWRTDFYRPAEFLAYWGESDLHDNQTVPEWMNHPTVLLRRSLWERVGGYPAMDVGEDAEFFARVHEYLGKEFIKYDLARQDRFMILRGASQYQHMSIDGGREPLNTAEGEYHIVPRPIADPLLRRLTDRLIKARGTAWPEQRSHHREGLSPVLSVCISLKNRSRIRYGDSELELFPNCFSSLKAAAETVGPLELVVADFDSDDWPLSDWLEGKSTDTLRIRTLRVNGPFSKGRGLNIAAQHATSDNLFLCDADMLVSARAIARGKEVLRQGEAFFPICRCANEDGRLGIWQDLGYGLVFVTRGTLNAAGGVPEFESWGGEDDLLHDRLKRHIGEVRERLIGLIHQWHPDSCRHSHYQRVPNADYWEAYSHPPGGLQPLRRFVGQHPHWVGSAKEIYLYENGRMERPGVDAGSFEFEDGVRLTLHWDNWPTERLVWEAATGQYRDVTKPFTLRAVDRDDGGSVESDKHHDHPAVAQPQSFADNLRLLNDVFQETPLHGHYWLAFGVLLGYRREGALLPHDPDVDFGILERNEQCFLDSVDSILAAGFQRSYRWTNSVGRVTEYCFMKDGAKFEFFVHFQDISAGKLRWYIFEPARRLEHQGEHAEHGFQEIQFLDRSWHAPDDIDRYLSEMYGDWQTPNPRFSNSDRPCIVRQVPWTGTHVWQ
jgi:glycosyltransferase involved in cell wall biosynthesis